MLARDLQIQLWMPYKLQSPQQMWSSGIKGGFGLVVAHLFSAHPLKKHLLHNTFDSTKPFPLARRGRTWAIAVRRGSHKSLFLPNSSHFSLVDHFPARVPPPTDLLLGLPPPSFLIRNDFRSDASFYLQLRSFCLWFVFFDFLWGNRKQKRPNLISGWVEP